MRSPGFAIRAARRIARTDAAIVHAFLPAIGFYGALAKRFFGLRKPMILSVGYPDDVPNERLLWRLLVRCYDRAIANSSTVQDVLCGRGFERSQVSLIPNGHDFAPYSLPLDRERIRATLGVQSQEKLLITVGRLIDSKRVCDAIAALATIRSNGHAAKLVVVGDGPNRAALERQANSLDVGNAVTFAGNRSDVIDLLRSADLFLFPSESEGLSNAVIEACLARLPIVACSIAGVAEIVHDGREAILAPPHSPLRLAGAVETCLRDHQLAERLAAAAHERGSRVQHRTIRVTAVCRSMTNARELEPGRRARQPSTHGCFTCVTCRSPSDASPP